MSQKQQIYDMLNDMGIPFRSVEHPAVFTVEEVNSHEFSKGARIAKNLFLRDAKGRRHFLITLDSARAVDIRSLEEILHSSHLSFASEARLERYLGLTRGSVGPFGLVNDPDGCVEFYFEDSLNDGEEIGLHPNDNTATVFIASDNLLSFIRSTGHEPKLFRAPKK